MMNAAKRQAIGERREQILDVAQRLFAQHGMAHVTTRQIAQEVGISQPSLYAHFATADEIGEQLCTRAFETLCLHIERVLGQSTDPADRLRTMGRAYVEFGLQNPDMYRIAFMLEETHDHKDEENDPVMSAGLRAFAALRMVVAELHGADDEMASIKAQSIWACVHGLTSLLLARPHFPWAEQSRLIDFHLASLAVSDRHEG